MCHIYLVFFLLIKYKLISLLTIQNVLAHFINIKLKVLCFIKCISIYLKSKPLKNMILHDFKFLIKDLFETVLL